VFGNLLKKMIVEISGSAWTMALILVLLVTFTGTVEAGKLIPGTVERPDITIFLLEGDHIPFSSLYMYERENIVYVDVEYLAAKLGGEHYGVRQGEFKFKIRDLVVVGKVGSNELYLRGRLEGPHHTTVYVCDKIRIEHRIKMYEGNLLVPLEDIAEVLQARLGTTAGLADAGCGRKGPIVIEVPLPPKKKVKKPKKKHGTDKDYVPFKEKYPMYLTINCEFSPQDILRLDVLQPFDPVTVLVPEGSALMVLGTTEEKQ
jgi:predicted small lipoprotein YifL